MAADKGIQITIGNLHRAYEQGRLRILVGAGASQRAGFPDWKSLERRLLRLFLEREIESVNSIFRPLIFAQLDKVTEDLYAELGQGATDLVRDRTKGSDFLRMLGKALYDQRRIIELPIPSLQRQIASMTKLVVYTTNYDPLLELAMNRVLESKRPQQDPEGWRRFHADVTSHNQQEYELSSRVYHIHGTVEPDGTAYGSCIATERDYHILSGDWRQVEPANALLHKVMSYPNVLLIVGMSLTDMNLKRMLYDARSSFKNSEIFALQRIKDEFLYGYQEMRWKELGVEFIGMRSYDHIEGLLRQVKYGAYEKGQIPRWIETSTKWLCALGISSDQIFTDSCQAQYFIALNELKSQLNLLFPASRSEDLHITFFMPISEVNAVTKLRLVAETGLLMPTGSQARERADIFEFNIRFKEEQGSSGAAFVTGRPVSVAGNRDLIYANIDASTLSRWQNWPGYKFYRSIISIPICDSEDYVPVAVISITSIEGVPFWDRFEESEPEQLNMFKQIIRSVVKAHLLRTDLPIHH